VEGHLSGHHRMQRSQGPGYQRHGSLEDMVGRPFINQVSEEDSLIRPHAKCCRRL